MLTPRMKQFTHDTLPGPGPEVNKGFGGKYVVRRPSHRYYHETWGSVVVVNCRT